MQALGPEPLADAQQETVFDGDYLFQRSRGRKAPIKTFLMDQRIVVGAVSYTHLDVYKRQEHKQTSGTDDGHSGIVSPGSDANA